MRALTIAWKDTRHVYRSIAGVAMMLAAPLLLTFALGAAFGSGDTFSIAAVKVVVVNQDSATGTSAPTAGAALVAALTSPEMAKLCIVRQIQTAEAALAAVNSGDAAVAVIIPSGLSSSLMDDAAGTDGASTVSKVQIYRDPTLNIGPSIITSTVNSVLQSLNGAQAAASAAVELAASAGVRSNAELTDLASKTAQSFIRSAQTETPISIKQRDPIVSEAEAQKRPNVASQVLVGMMLFFMLFGAATPARSIIDEHRHGTLSRLFTTPAPRSVILGGKYVAVFLVVLIQAIVLLLAGWLLMKADWGEPGPVVVLTLVSALVSAALGLATVSLAKTPAQAGAVSSAIFVFLALISGNFVGSANLGGTFAIVRRVSPVGWLMEGWNNLLYGGSWASIALPAVVAMAFAVALFGVAVFFFRRRYV